MEYTVYLDVFWSVNCFVTIVLWIWVKNFLGKTSKMKNIIFVGMLGGTIASGLLWIYFFSIEFPCVKYLVWMIGVVLYIGIVCGMIHILFANSNKKERKKIFFVYHFAAIVFAGFLNFVPVPGEFGWELKKSTNTLSIWELFGKSLIFLGTLPVINNFFQQKKITETGYYPIEVERKGKKQQGIGLLDTGNGLRSVFTNEPVVLVEFDFIKPILSEKEQGELERLLQWEVGAQEIDEKVVCIPYHSIGNDGVLFGIYIDHLRVYQEKRIKDHVHALIGLYTEKLSAKEEYQVILHVDCVE